MTVVFAMVGCAQLPNGEPPKLQDRSEYQSPDILYGSYLPSVPIELKAQQQRFDVNARNVPAKDFYQSLVEGTDINMIIPESVQGRISISLKSVTIDETLQAIRDSYGFDFVKNRYGYRIKPRTIQTKLIKLNYINVNRSGSTNVTVNSGRLSDANSTSIAGLGSAPAPLSGNATNSQSSSLASAQLSTQSSSDFWESLSSILTSMISPAPEKMVTVDRQSGIVVVKAMANEIALIEDYLNKAELSLQKQVVIEARILEVQLSEGFESGIDWQSFQGSDFASSGEDFGATLDPAEIIADSLGGLLTFNITDSNFQAVIQLLQTQGDVQVLSNPKISTVNNQKAVIKVGVDEYFVTDISSQQNSTVAGVTQTPEISLTPFFSGIALDVTPQISDENSITLHVHPSVTEVTENNKAINISGIDYNFPSAVTSIRESDSIIKARSGEVVIIGGLIQDKMEERASQIPLLGDIPWLGELFKQKKKVSTKSELVILLQPRVVDQGWQGERAELNESPFLMEY